MTEQNLSTLSSSSAMTSREIAQLTGKQHKNVLRDIDNLLKTLSSELSAGFSMTYEGDAIPMERRLAAPDYPV